ncbi:MAG: protein-L-isoaspartate O-methyltransferase family protein, partial [Methylococcales bacterium]
MHDIDQLIHEIEKDAEWTHNWTGRSRLYEAVIAAIREVPRDQFVPDSARHLAYHNGPLSIGYGQTISQPFIVALMTDLLNPR